MPNNAEVDKAMKALNGEELKGSIRKVSEARPRSKKRKPGGNQAWRGRW